MMGGVALASLTELSFNWLSFGAAMVSNVASAARGIVGKISMGKPVGQNMNAVNLVNRNYFFFLLSNDNNED